MVKKFKIVSISKCFYSSEDIMCSVLLSSGIKERECVWLWKRAASGQVISHRRLLVARLVGVNMVLEGSLDENQTECGAKR